jgi:hypothetical protein
MGVLSVCFAAHVPAHVGCESGMIYVADPSPQQAPFSQATTNRSQALDHVRGALCPRPLALPAMLLRMSVDLSALDTKDKQHPRRPWTCRDVAP